MRDVAEALERLGLAWYLTGSEALAAYGSPRQTLDIDLIVDADAASLRAVAGSLEATYYFAEPLQLENRMMASLVDRTGGAKVDLIVRDDDAWGREAMRRRVHWAHPIWGSTWVSSLEDLILAKLEWSGGTSELQLRDCRILLRMNAETVDRDYLESWSRSLGVERWLTDVSERGTDAT